MNWRQRRARRRSRSAAATSRAPRCAAAVCDLLGRELQPELRGLVDGLEEELVVVRPLLRRLLEREQLVGAQVALVVARRVAGQDRLGVVLARRSRGRVARLATPEHTSAHERPLLGRRPGARARGGAARPPPAPANARRVRRPARTSSARARRSGARSRTTASARRSSTARRGAARRRSRGSSRARPAPSSRSCRPSRPRSPTCARVLARARERLGAHGQRTILFLDEIHRFNKAQQDALLPAVEEGPDHADRRDDREPLLRGQLGAALALPGLRARAARRGRARRRSSARGARELGRRGAGRARRG